MQQFIDKFGEHIDGILSGFDRLILRGTLRRLQYVQPIPGEGGLRARGMEEYLWQNKVLFKDYKAYMEKVSERIKRASTRAVVERGEKPIFQPDPKVDKDAMAREVAKERKITSGLVCIISSMEPSPTFEHRGQYVVRRTRPCHVLYHYQIDPQLGWMHARIQTWFPFNIQIAVNGREWLSRQMDQEGLRYLKQDNCFPWIESYQRAQELMNEQLKTNWAELLGGFARQLNPIHEEIFEKYPTDYYWTSFQSEWATDLVFRKAEVLKRLMPLMVRHSVLGFSCADIMRYLGKKVNRSGEIPAGFSGTLQADLKRRQEGQRIKYRMNGNSGKYYDKAYTDLGSLLRVETTVTTTTDFRVYRPKEGGPEDDLAWRPLRLGIADIHRRAEVSNKTNERLLNALADVDDSRSVEELTADIQKSACIGGRKVRGLRPWGEDKDLLAAINHGDFLLNGFRNRDLQNLLFDTEAKTTAERKRRSAAISRKLRMLRAHGLIQKVTGTHRYHVSKSGRVILLAILTVAKTSLNQLNRLAAAA